MKTGELMEIALKAGEILLRSGAEIYRIEETIRRICNSYGTECESFVLPTGIFISIKDKAVHEMFTSVKRISQRTVDLNRIDRVNSLSRQLHPEFTFGEAMDELKEIEQQGQYSFFSRLGAASVASFVFTVLFKGSIYEGIASFLIGLIIFSVRELLSKTGLFQFFELLVSGLIAGSLAVLSVFLFPGFHLFKIIIGSIMIFLPGVAITNSIKDALYGDIVASISRMGEALFTAFAVGAGVGIAVSLGLSWGL